MSFRLKQWIGHVRCDKTRNGFGGLTRAFNAPDTDFHNGSGAATKWRETT